MIVTEKEKLNAKNVMQKELLHAKNARAKDTKIKMGLGNLV